MTSRISAAALFLAAAALICSAQPSKIVWSEEKPILEQMRKLRGMPDDLRAATTRQLAVQIRALPAAPSKAALAESLANLVTEGDPGLDTLQEVANTLAEAIHEQPPAANNGQPFVTLAQLVRYEQVKLSIDDPRFASAMTRLESDDEARQHANFTLSDLNGKTWTLQDLHGKVVVVNFWATWCPPCRKEMPDLEALYQRFAPKGLVILAISDEDPAKVQPFIAEHHFTYPILLDPGRKVNDLFHVEGIPKTFVYDREGQLAAEAIDMRTQHQFLAMLAKAGLP